MSIPNINPKSDARLPQQVAGFCRSAQDYFVVSTEEQSNSPRSVMRCAVRFCACAVMLIVSLAVAWSIFGIVADGIDAKLIALNSDDAEQDQE